MATAPGDLPDPSMPAAPGGQEPYAEALTRTLHRRAIAQGTIRLPAAPALLEEYVRICLRTFAAVGVRFDDAETDSLREVLREQLERAFAGSPRSEIVITYDAPVGHEVQYLVTAQWATIEETYDAWVATREAPYFGTEPDARVWALASEHPDPATCPVLDIGAGTGRNALALARRGHPVDALEVSGRFADALREQAQAQSLPVRVVQRDAFSSIDVLPRDYRIVVVSEVVSDFRSVDELRAVLSLASACLVEGGQLVMNSFLTVDGYEPDEAARQLGQQTYSGFFTRDELAAATAGLPLVLVEETSVIDYEHAHQPPASWPPTGWYEGWVTGQDVFGPGRGTSPIEMRWLVYRRTGDAPA